MERRIHEIDLLRFLAAFAVMLYHYMYRGWSADDMSLLTFPEFGHFFQYGYLGVDLFFMISGFVIMMTAINKNCTNFIISRMTRLYPAFWFSVTLTTVVTLLIGGDRYNVNLIQYLANMTMLHKFINIPHIDGVYWSLIVELKFYFLILILIFLKQLHNIKLFLSLWLALAVILNITGKLPILTALFIPDWAAYFIAGAAFFLIKTKGVSIHYITLVFICYLLALTNAINSISKHHEKYGIEPSAFIVSLFITLFFLFFMALSLNKTQALNKPSFAYLGVMTYPLYLLHENIGFMIFNILHNSINKYVLLTGVSVLMLALAYIVSKYIETPCARLLKSSLTRTFNRAK